jgi:hypothetical protein
VALARVDSPVSDFLARADLAAGGSSLKLRTPDEPARLEARYYAALPGGALRLLGRSAPFETTAAPVSIQAPAKVEGGSLFEVSWTNPGPASDDYLVLVKAGTGRNSVVSYIGQGKVTLRAPAIRAPTNCATPPRAG